MDTTTNGPTMYCVHTDQWSRIQAVPATACLVQWLARLTAIQKVPGSIPGYTLEIFLEVYGLERGPPSLVRTIGQLLDIRISEIRLRKLKLRFLANHKASCTVIWQQPLQSVLALQNCSATDNNLTSVSGEINYYFFLLNIFFLQEKSELKKEKIKKII